MNFCSEFLHVFPTPQSGVSKMFLARDISRAIMLCVGKFHSRKYQA